MEIFTKDFLDTLNEVGKMQQRFEELCEREQVAVKSRQELYERLDTQAKGLNGLGKELRGRIDHLESLSIPPLVTDHGKYQKLVEACREHLESGTPGIDYHSNIKEALNELF